MMCDGLVYAQLGAALPGSGGPYVYLREAYRPWGVGRLMSFLFIFQVILVAPLSIAGGAVGLVDYLGHYWHTSKLVHDLVAAGVCLVMTALLWRNIQSAGRLSVIMLAVTIVTVVAVVVIGLMKFSFAQAFDFPPQAFEVDRDFVTRLGAVALLAMYNYGGYNNVCNIAEEIRAPERTLPRSIILSIVLVIALYIVMSVVILGVVPWQEAQDTQTIASVFVARAFADPDVSRIAAAVITGLILFVTASSLYAWILSYSRIPFAAARDGQFFRIFAKLHPTKDFPYVSLLFLGAASIPFCFFSLGELVSWLLMVQIVLQFIWQCAGVILLRRHRSDIVQPFRMVLYPLPALIALALWLYVFFSAPLRGILFAFGYLLAGVLAYALFARRSAPTDA
jgi:amino acid transporter